MPFRGKPTVRREVPFLEAYFANIVELSEDAIISVRLDQRIRLFNQGAEAIFGYTEAEVLGQFLDLLLPDRFRADHREHAARFAASGERLRPMNARQTIYGRRKDGTEFPAEATITQFTVQGETVLTVRLRDITARQQAEAALRASEQRLTADLEAMTRLQRIGNLFVAEGNLEAVLGEIVDAAIALSGAECGTIQLVGPDADLHIVGRNTSGMARIHHHGNTYGQMRTSPGSPFQKKPA